MCVMYGPAADPAPVPSPASCPAVGLTDCAASRGGIGSGLRDVAGFRVEPVRPGLIADLDPVVREEPLASKPLRRAVLRMLAPRLERLMGREACDEQLVPFRAGVVHAQ